MATKDVNRHIDLGGIPTVIPLYMFQSLYYEYLDKAYIEVCLHTSMRIIQ